MPKLRTKHPDVLSASFVNNTVANVTAGAPGEGSQRSTSRQPTGAAVGYRKLEGWGRARDLVSYYIRIATLSRSTFQHTG